MCPSEELLHAEHLGPSELEASVPGSSREDKGSLQPPESKDGEQIRIRPPLGAAGSLSLSSAMSVRLLGRKEEAVEEPRALHTLR